MSIPKLMEASGEEDVDFIMAIDTHINDCAVRLGDWC